MPKRHWSCIYTCRRAVPCSVFRKKERINLKLAFLGRFKVSLLRMRESMSHDSQNLNKFMNYPCSHGYTNKKHNKNKITYSTRFQVLAKGFIGTNLLFRSPPCKQLCPTAIAFILIIEVEHVMVDMLVLACTYDALYSKSSNKYTVLHTQGL